MQPGHVKIRNNGRITYREEYQGNLISIEPGECIEMPRGKAVHFLGQFRPFQRDGTPETQGRKPLEIIEDPEQHAAKRDQPFRFQASDGTKFRTKEGVTEHENQLNFKSGGKGVKTNQRA